MGWMISRLRVGSYNGMKYKWIPAFTGMTPPVQAEAKRARIPEVRNSKRGYRIAVAFPSFGLGSLGLVSDFDIRASCFRPSGLLLQISPVII
jgi:hypothetical protein